jgi:hypothetical protein
MVLVFNTPLYLACKWAISKDQIICLWKLVSSIISIEIDLLYYAYASNVFSMLHPASAYFCKLLMLFKYEISGL